MNTIKSITPTICKAMSVDFECPAVPFEQVLSLIDQKIDKCLVFAPDALGLHLQDKLPIEFEKLKSASAISVDISAVVPPVTPVCFASMYTGLSPDEHDITHYNKTVLTCDTIFDFLLSAGKKVAIVTTKESSIDIIFRNRGIDYFSLDTDEDVITKTIELLKEDKHDFILSYNCSYDDALHETTPFSDKALDAARKIFQSVFDLNDEFNKHWKGHNRLMTITPDHGAHIDSKTGKGDHGLDIPEDMELIHSFFIEYAG